MKYILSLALIFVLFSCSKKDKNEITLQLKDEVVLALLNSLITTQEVDSRYNEIDIKTKTEMANKNEAIVLFLKSTSMLISDKILFKSRKNFRSIYLGESGPSYCIAYLCDEILDSKKEVKKQEQKK